MCVPDLPCVGLCIYTCVSGDCLAGISAGNWPEARSGSREGCGGRKAPTPLAGVRSADNIVRAWGGGNNGNFLAWACGPSFGK